MSMTVKISMKGITDLEVLIEALQEMGIKTLPAHAGETSGNKILTYAEIQNHRIGFMRNPNGEITMRGDGDWKIMRDKHFQQELRRKYSLEIVKRKVAELRYHLASVDTMEDGSIKVVARAWR